MNHLTPELRKKWREEAESGACTGDRDYRILALLIDRERVVWEIEAESAAAMKQAGDARYRLDFQKRDELELISDGLDIAARIDRG